MASFDAASTIGRALDALARQDLAAGCEVVVIDSGGDDTAALVAREHPEAILLRSPSRLFAGEARHRGAAVARGELLAFVDADCVVASDWARHVVAAHAAPHPVIGGVVENGNPGDTTAWAYYFAEFHRWLPGQPAGFVDEVPACTMTMKRETYERFGPFLAGAYCSDTQFVWRLAAAGIRPYLDPEIRVAHLNPTRLGAALRHEVRHGRDFARLRSRERLGRAGALARALAAPALPPLLLARAARSARRRPELHRPLRRALPRLAALVAAWSLGELAGYAEAALARPRSAA